MTRERQPAPASMSSRATKAVAAGVGFAAAQITYSTRAGASVISIVTTPVSCGAYPDGSIATPSPGLSPLVAAVLHQTLGLVQLAGFALALAALVAAQLPAPSVRKGQSR